jgi:hypothetical protein
MQRSVAKILTTHVCSLLFLALAALRKSRASVLIGANKWIRRHIGRTRGETPWPQEKSTPSI